MLLIHPPSRIPVQALLFSLVLALAGVAPAIAQTPTTGTVIARVIRADSAALDGAVVRGGSLVSRTNDQGIAILQLPAGEHTIVATRLGFRPDSARVLVTAGASVPVTILLEAQAAVLAGVIVAATRSERRVEDDPERVEVLTREEVEEKLLMTPGDITMMLNETSGLRVQTTSPSLGGANVRVQGLRGRYTQLLSDGLPLHGGQTGGLGLLQIPPMDLGGLEVIKGVASALYGSSALGGVINLISRRPGDENVRELLLNQTTLGGTDIVAFLASRAHSDVEPTAISPFSYTLLGGAHLQRQRDRDADGWTDVPGYERFVIRPRIFLGPAGTEKVMVTAGATVEDRDGGTMPGRTVAGTTQFPERLRTERFDAGGSARFHISDRGVLGLRASASSQTHDHHFGAVLERDKHATSFAEGAYTIQPRAFTWVMGAAFQQERYAAVDVEGFDFVFTTHSVFAQGIVDPAPWLSITASGRADRHNHYGSFASPRLALLLRPAEGWTVRASAGGGYFAPTPFTEETEVIGLAPVEAAHWKELEAERVRSASLDIGRSLGPFEMNWTLFGSEIRNPVSLRELESPGGVELVNAAGRTHTAGGELVARLHREPLHVTASYTYVRARETDVENSLRRQVPLTPRHQAGLVTMWESEASGRAGVEIYYTGRQLLEDDPYRSESRPHVHIGVLAERRVGAARFFVNVENLLNVRQTRYDPLVRPQPGPGGRWTNDVWAPLEGTVANAGVRIDWR